MSRRRSELLSKNRDEMVQLSRRMKPEERLMAYLRYSRLVRQIYDAGVRYRQSPSRKKAPR